MTATASVENRDELREIVERVVGASGLELVDLVLRRVAGRRILRVDIDRAGPVGVSLEDCQRVSDALGDALETVDPIDSNYVLEISSPGLDRPIRTADDIRRNTGRRVEVTTRNEATGTVRYRGWLRGGDAGDLVLEQDGGEALRIPLSEVVLACQELEF